MAAATTLDESAKGDPGRPYPPSWMDALIDAIDRLPAPSWLVYVALFALIGGYFGSFPSLAGTAPPFTIDPVWAALAFYPVFTLAASHYLNDVARRSLNSFSPVLALDEQHVARLRYEVATFPAVPGALAGLVAGSLAALYRVTAPLQIPGQLPVLAVSEAVGAIVSYAIVGVFVARTIRQLQLVSRIQAMATRIDLFHASSLYAFSELTVRTAVVIVTVMAFSIIGGETGLPNLLGQGVMASVVFLLPLTGMQRRIARRKAELQAEAGRRLEAMIGELHRSVDGNDLTRAEEIHDTMASLILERDAVDRLSTWPWRSSTFGAFATLVAGPIVIWLATRLLERVI